MKSVFRLLLLSLASMTSYAATTAPAPVILPLMFNGSPGPIVNYNPSGASVSVEKGESLFLLVNNVAVSINGLCKGEISLKDGVPDIRVTDIGLLDSAGIQIAAPANTPVQVTFHDSTSTGLKHGTVVKYTGGRSYFGAFDVGSVDENMSIEGGSTRHQGTMSGHFDAFWAKSSSTGTAVQHFESVLADYSNATPFVHRKLATVTTSGTSGHAKNTTTETSMRWFAGGTNVDATIGGTIPGSISGTSNTSVPSLKVNIGIE